MSERPTHLLPMRWSDEITTLCGRDRFTTPHVRIDHAQDHIEGYGMPVCPECITVTGWACRRCRHVQQPPELFSPYPILTVAACTRCVITDQHEEVPTP